MEQKIQGNREERMIPASRAIRTGAFLLLALPLRPSPASAFHPAPGGVTASEGGSVYDAVSIYWFPVQTGGVEGYHVYRCATDQTGSCTHVDFTPEIIYQDSGGEYSTWYYYRVKTQFTDGEASDYSDYDMGWRRIPWPLNVSATDGVSTDHVTITWDEVEGAVSYSAYRCEDTGENNCTYLGYQVNTSQVDIQATPGVYYYYRVIACLPVGSVTFGQCSLKSSYDQGFRQMSPPTGVSASDAAYAQKVVVTWYGTEGALSYRVYRCTGLLPTTCTYLGGPPEGLLTYNDTQRDPGKLWVYRVKSVGEVGTSEYSDYDFGSFRELTVSPVLQLLLDE